MEFEITFDERTRLVTARASGAASLDGCIAYARGILSLPQWRPDTSVLADLLDLDLGALTGGEMRSLADFHVGESERFGRGQLAIVTRGAVDLGMARMWQAFVQRGLCMETRIFSSVEPARAWLGQFRPRAA